VLDDVRDVDLGTGQPGIRERPVEEPTDRTDEGLAARSSRSPGCSPTSAMRALDGPSPKTAWVASTYRSHPRQVWTAAVRSDGDPDAGTNRSAPGCRSS
jgi:hypothetical protein